MRYLFFLLFIFCVSCASTSTGNSAINEWMELNIPKYVSYVSKDTSLKSTEKEAIGKAANDVLLLSRERVQKNE